MSLLSRRRLSGHRSEDMLYATSVLSVDSSRNVVMPMRGAGVFMSTARITIADWTFGFRNRAFRAYDSDDTLPGSVRDAAMR